ncbi:MULTISPECIES: ABC transporter permease [unclassified Acidocella]|uniref:ABC transporter permease n=1 Tax=unclassified Acidocella TaxID=2648610 RepID=UPI00028C3097|nr:MULTISPECIES: ABC transporter permease [unclassified Acidocella]EKM98453.1 putative ABC transporter permease [Acidocella sp. MX-AZ02]WBO59172.1 ABC transporter permease [Acidocella sp. MX-AZ03]
MMKMILRRLASSCLSLFILVALVFFLAHLTPGGPAYSILGQKATPESVAQLNQRLGLDQPLPKQFGLWIWHLLHGELGYSYLLNRPVGQLLWVYERNTLVFYTVSIIISTALSIALGLIQGVWFGRWPAKLIGAFQLGFYALPPFFVAAMLILWFAVDVHWLPASGIIDLRDPHAGIASFAAHLVLPVTTVSLLTVSSLSRYFGEAVHEELGKDYVRTARAKGVSFTSILFRHVMRNALRPLITILGLSFPYIFTGGVIVESVFNYPGLGWLMWRSALSQDYPILIAIVLVIGVLTVLGNLLADLVNGLLDPRASYE